MGKRSADVREESLERDAYQCQACRSTNRDTLTVHHIKRLSQGGADDPINTITLCGTCHKKIEVLYDQKKYSYKTFYQWLELEWKKSNEPH